MKVYCRNCKWYSTKSRESDVSTEYTDVVEVIKSPIDGKPIEPMLHMRICSDLGWIKMCCHPSCFTFKTDRDIVKGEFRTIKRIQGQAQLNNGFYCFYYVRKWFLFWNNKTPKTCENIKIDDDLTSS